MKSLNKQSWNSIAWFGALGTSVVLALAWIIRSKLPKHFVGDDLLLLAASRSENGYASSFWSGFSDVGMGKWRPAFSTLVSIVLKAFGENLWLYVGLNLLLLAAVAIAARNLLRVIVGELNLWSTLIAPVVLLSQFSWYSAWSPYGLMELGALLSFIGALALLATALENGDCRINWTASTVLMLAVCFHERYLICYAATLLIIVWQRRSHLLSSIIPWVSLPCAYLFVKVILLRLDPLTGGGEAQFRASAGTWIVGRVLESGRAMIGGATGEIIPFDSTGERRLTQLPPIYLLLYSAAVMCMAVIGLCRLSLMTNVDRPRNPRSRHLVLTSLLFVSSMFLLLPASTVISRIEPRWLFGSHIMFAVIALTLAHLTRDKISKIASRTLVVVISCGLVASAPNRQHFEYEARRADRLIVLVGKAPMPDPDWTLVIRDRSMTHSYWSWLLGRGSAFSKLSNPPGRFLVGFESCQATCLEVDVNAWRWKITRPSN